MAVIVGERLRAFAAEKMPAILGTVRSDGSAQLNPVWFEYADGYFWINGGPQRAWLRHIRRHPKQLVTLLLVDPKSMWRWAQIQGRVVEVTEEGAWEHIDRLSQRYLGSPYMRRPGDQRLKIKIEPLRITGGENRQPWDVSATTPRAR